MSNITILKQTSLKYKITLISVISTLILGIILPTIVSANNYQQQIQSLQAENSSLESASRNLASEAADLQTLIAGLQSEISTLEGQIRENNAKKARVQGEIDAAQIEIAHQKKLLGENIKAMYLEGDISTIEILASSNNISDFVDQQQYRLTIEERISEMHAHILALHEKLTAQKAELEKIIADLAGIQGQLNAQRAEQARLLALNEQQRASLNAEMQANSRQVSKLRAQQAAENARLFGSGRVNAVDSSGYPYANVQPFPNAKVDPWGMYMRQCVSYTAWKVAASGRHMPYWGGFGNANRWANNARRAGIPVDRNPRVGDVAVSLAGYYGHVMYVEAVYGDGTIYISQYNGAWDGKYSEARISVGNLEFIHF